MKTIKAQRFVTFVFAAIALGFVFSIGPSIQQYFIALINSKAPSIYGSVYKQDLIQFPTLAVWLSSALNWEFFVVGGFVAWLGLKAPEPRAIFFRVTVAGFLIISLFDTGIGIYSHLFSFAWVVENLVSNLIGACLVGLLLVVMLSVTDYSYLHAPFSAIIGRLTALSILLFLSFICCTFVYYLIEFFYEPLPARFDAYFTAPASGAVATTAASGSEGSERPFSFFPDKEIHASLIWAQPEGEIHVETLPNNDKKGFIEVSFLSECNNAEEVKKLLPSVKPWATLPATSGFSIAIDKGPSDLFVFPLGSGAGVFDLKTAHPTYFYVNQDGKEGNLKLTRFVGSDAAVEFRKPGGDFAFVISSPLMQINSKVLKFVPRILTMAMGKEAKTITLQVPSAKPDLKHTMVCAQSLTSPPAFSTNKTVLFQPSTEFVSILVVVRAHAEAQSFSFADSGIHATGTSGWLAAEGVKPQEISGQEIGRLDMIQLQGNISELIVDDIVLPTHQIESYVALGALRAKFGDSGKIRVWGDVKSLWRDTNRLNSTKWEGLGWEPKAFILGLLATIIGAIGAVFGKCMSTNARFKLLT